MKLKVFYLPLFSAVLVLLSCASGHRELLSENHPAIRDIDSLEKELQVLCSGLEFLEPGGLWRLSGAFTATDRQVVSGSAI
ncbi:MAG: hypothetical protein JSV89_11000 [Spirochaetaceae bacterium]|nr:MAG: hypothetical protein JSV89_11000 [Spirochaetaceae bacterium]